MRLSVTVLALVSAVASMHPASAAETICLKSGFCLEADSHTSTAGTLVVHLGPGTLEYAAEDIASIESHLSDSNKPPAPQKSSDAAGLNPSEPSPGELIAKAAEQEGLASHADFLLSVAKIESALKQSAVSKKGAIGLMQLMPGTAAALGCNAKDASENALGGAAYLRSLLIRYHGDSALALAAYNAGPAAVDRFHGIPPYEETRSYVVRVLREYEREQQARANVPPTTRTAGQ